MILPIKSLRAADLLNVCCHIQKECCPSFNVARCANMVPVGDVRELLRHCMGVFMERHDLLCIQS